jgi:hypothetical protein
MPSAKNVGRIIGIVLILNMAAEFVVNSVLLGPLMAPPGFLVNAADDASRVRVAVLLGFVSAGLTLGIAIAAWPVFRRHAEIMAISFLALSIIAVALRALENATLLTMLSVSQEHARAGAPAELFQSSWTVARSARNWTHYTSVTVAGCAILVLYATLWRYALVPRALALFGIVAALLQIIAVTRPFVGQPVLFSLIMPLALSHLTLSLWLMARGLAEPAPS